MKNRIARGFTLIELMIVVAIIGIVAVVAISAYQDYLARSQMSEAINLLGAGKTPLAEHYADKGIWPAAAADVISNTSGRYVAAIDVVGGNSSSSPEMTLQATMKTSNLSALISGRTAWMVTNDGGRNWQCTTSGSNGVSAKYLPGACR